MDRFLQSAFFILFSILISLGESTCLHAEDSTQTEVRQLSQERVSLLKTNLTLKGAPQYFQSLYELGGVYWKHALKLRNDVMLMQEAQKKWQALLEIKEANLEWKNRAHFALAESYFFQTNFSLAMEHYHAVRPRFEVVTALKKEIASLEENKSRAQEKEILKNLLQQTQSGTDLKIESQIRTVACLNNLKSYGKARQLVEECLPLANEKQKENLIYQKVLSELLEGKSEAEEGLKSFEAHYGFNASTEEGYWIWIQKLLAKKDQEKAIFYLKRLMDQSPQGRFAKEGQALLDKLNKEKATHANSSELSWSEILALAKSLRDKDAERARKECDRIIAAPLQEVALKVEAMWLAGEILRDQREYDKAAGYFEMIDVFFGESAKEKSMLGLWEAGKCYEKAGMKQEKKRVYENLLERYPENPFRKQIELSLKELS
ncbi:MAG: tetratricopeptide repeat protein [Verrucomicrobiae bacterium]|nr:tetratricopeptide repeat protein [Verrucomicrobiae bacterium]